MTLVTWCELIAALMAFGYLGLTARDPSLLRSVVKTGSVVLLALAAQIQGAPVMLVLGLGACAFGDLFLSRDGTGMFMAGVGAFALGHLGYVALFLADTDSQPSQILAQPYLLAAIGFLLLGLAMAKVLAPRAGALRGAVLCYVPIILSMGLAALTLGDRAGPWVLAAALAFIASDVALAFETFVLKAHQPARRLLPYVVWPLYWGAQLGFYLSFS